MPWPIFKSRSKNFLKNGKIESTERFENHTKYRLNVLVHLQKHNIFIEL